jgi:hypothetical protein
MIPGEKDLAPGVEVGFGQTQPGAASAAALKVN